MPIKYQGENHYFVELLRAQGHKKPLLWKSERSSVIVTEPNLKAFLKNKIK